MLPFSIIFYVEGPFFGHHFIDDDFLSQNQEILEVLGLCFAAVNDIN